MTCEDARSPGRGHDELAVILLALFEGYVLQMLINPKLFSEDFSGRLLLALFAGRNSAYVEKHLLNGVSYGGQEPRGIIEVHRVRRARYLLKKDSWMDPGEIHRGLSIRAQLSDDTRDGNLDRGHASARGIEASA